MPDPTEQVNKQLRKITGRDLVAGITNAVTNIPDAMANAVLAGMNPVQGLYALMIGTPVGSLTTGSQLMTVAVTGAMSLIVGDALAGIPGPDRVATLLALTVMVGVIQLALGLARTGTLLRFVSNGVLRGFLLGVAVNIVLSQVPNVTGFSSSASNKVIRVFDTALHPRQLDLHAMVIALLAVAVVLIAERTPLKKFAFLAGLVVSASAAVFLKWDVPTVKTLSEIPRALPMPRMPSLALGTAMVVPALSIALVGLIQGAGVSKSTPNRDGSYPDVNRDFIGQGVANAAAGIFGGVPVGGSVSSSALVSQLGATSRFANFIVGPIIALVVLFLGNAVEMIPLATLGALLMIVGLRALNLPAVEVVWNTSVPSRAIMGVTFIAMMIVPVQYAVLLGVALSFVQHVYSASLDIRVVELDLTAQGGVAETPAPKVLPSNKVTALDIYGSVFYAGADVIAQLLPEALGATRAVGILRLRGRTDVGSTFLGILARYQDEIVAGGGRLMLSGVGPELRDQLERTGMLARLGEENIFLAQPVLTASMREAVDAGNAWLAQDASR
jgi:SulP family sulfate permease